ncbi:MAG TPA: AAA family ATPase [Acidimicrobiales bacterium]|nr:AAA family ATPase [Acidimicrobiales bacterium]
MRRPGVGRPGVIVLAGLPGAGKSTLAAAIAARLPDVRVVDKDEVRHALFAPCDYSAAERDITFSVMLDAARYHLGRGRIIIFDGLTFSRRTEVEAAEAVARESDGFSAVIVCDVPVEVAIERCEHDAADGAHPAGNRDGDLVRRVAAEMEEPGGAYMTLPATRPVQEAVELALDYIEDCATPSSG